MQITFTRHLFATLTYSRDKSVHERWESISTDFNRYCQRFRRLHKYGLEYLRVYEEHKDGYPHIHCLVQFPYAAIRIENARYFDKELYQRWRLLWPHGHTDYQKPRQTGTGALSYVMKYLIKNQTSKTVWKKVLSSSAQPVCADVSITPDSLTSNAPNTNAHVIPTLPTHMNGVKLCSWSRKFDFRPFTATSN